MKILMKLFLITFLCTACNLLASNTTDEKIETKNIPIVTNTTPPEIDGVTPITTELRTYMFGHSLLNHSPTGEVTSLEATTETQVAHWLYYLSLSAGYDFRYSGQYGFLLQHMNFPPSAQWGLDFAPYIWDDDSTVTFSEVGFDTILLTPANYIQYETPTANYYENGAETDESPVDRTVIIFDYVKTETPEATLYIYENWPDMAGFIDGYDYDQGIFPTETQVDEYHAYTIGEFHDWWVTYQDLIIERRPTFNVKLIPVGSIMAKLLTLTALNDIPVNELYEDDAPHGRPNIYFLSGLITYMSMYGVKAPADYIVPDNISSVISDNYSYIVDYIWNELIGFVHIDESSRVF